MAIFSNQVFQKFLKAFLTGGVVAIGAILAAGVSVHNLTDAKGVAIILISAFLSGGFHAIWQMIYPTLPANTQTVATFTTVTPPVITGNTPATTPVNQAQANYVGTITATSPQTINSFGGDVHNVPPQ